MGSLISNSPEETEAFGERLAHRAPFGCVIGLTGDLGAGKTCLVRGLARGLGAQTKVHSPTFSLVNIYMGGRWTLYHLDLYRLETAREIVAAGLEEYFQPDGIAVVEWMDRWTGPSPSCYLPVAIESKSETERRIVYGDVSP